MQGKNCLNIFIFQRYMRTHDNKMVYLCTPGVVTRNVSWIMLQLIPGGATFRETEMLVCIFSLFDNNIKRWYNLLKGVNFF